MNNPIVISKCVTCRNQTTNSTCIACKRILCLECAKMDISCKVCQSGYEIIDNKPLLQRRMSTVNENGAKTNVVNAVLEKKVGATMWRNALNFAYTCVSFWTFDRMVLIGLYYMTIMIWSSINKHFN